MPNPEDVALTILAARETRLPRLEQAAMERAIQYTGTQLPFLLATVSILAFANTLHADFAFDDNYAIQRNRDVMDPAASWWGMMQHDFWGQNIWKPDSHKSYR
jgi:hypothetical protein